MTAPPGPRLFLLFNHNLTDAQDADAKASLGINEIIAAPHDIQALWSQLPPEAGDLAGLLAPVADWLTAVSRPGDFILIQGDFSATFLMVSEAMRLGLIPVSSTTRRVVVEEHQADGSVHLRHTFRHVRFRRYQSAADATRATPPPQRRKVT